MVEMRWIIVPVGSGRGLVGGSAGQMHETVLQYRYKTFKESPISGLGAYGEWSEWQDAAAPGSKYPSGG